MADIEKVISDLEQQIRWIEEIECHKFPGWLNTTNAMRDALELLKEQEPAEPVMKKGRLFTAPMCRKCGYFFPTGTKPNYCQECGQAVKWN